MSKIGLIIRKLTPISSLIMCKILFRKYKTAKMSLYIVAVNSMAYDTNTNIS